MTFSRPGVYISERDLPTPVTSVGTANAAGACIGYFPKGPEAVTRVASWYEFATTFGDLNPLYPATYGVNQFFQNGGDELYVRRVVKDAALSSSSVVAQVHATDITGVTGTASSGSVITLSGANATKVKVGMTVAGTNVASGTVVNSIAVVSSAVTITVSKAITGALSSTALTFSGAPTTKFVSKYKGADANLLRVQLTPVAIATLSVTALAYDSASCTITVSTPSTLKNSVVVGQFVTISGAESSGYNVVQAKVVTATDTSFTLNVQVAGSTTTSIATATVYGDYWNVIVAKETVTDQVPDLLQDDIVLETFNNIVFNNKLSSDYIGTILTLQSQYIKVDETSGGPFIADNRPAYSNPLVFTGGLDGTAPGETEYSTAVLNDFNVLERPLVLFAPELVNQGLSSSDVKTVQNRMTAWAEANGKSFVLLDTPSGTTTANAIAWSNSLKASSNGAIYFPNLYIPDNKAKSANAVRLVAPSSSVAGLTLATDRAVGPQKSVAGIGAKISTAVALETAFTSTDLDSLNDSTNPVNAIRNLPGSGIVVMGGRTLKSTGSITKYISTRRSMFYIKRQMEVLTQFALFENNSELLWSRIRTAIVAFLNEYRNQGGLRGNTIDESFYVKCDAENNDATSIAAGIVNVEVGVALERPAEFVVITLSQMTTI